MECRRGCGACCIAPSIHSPLPGMPEGKPAGLPCVNLDPVSRDCRLWGGANYPECCRAFRPASDSCGESPAEAMRLLDELERLSS
ncbi:MAG: YkgJ family cysteine cluster protein [Pseudomonadota bacterium]